MQMHSVDTSAGTAICWAPSRMAWMTGLPMSRLRLMFSTSTVASSTRMPTASASPPSVMMLMVSPSRLRVMNGRQDRERDGHRDDEGAPPASEEEQDHHGGETGGDHRLPDHPANGRPHEDGLVGERLDLDLRRKGRHHAGQARADPGRDVERGRRAGR